MSAGAIELHVAVGGGDDAPGTAEAPLRTLTRARDALRERRARSDASGTATVLVHGGTHFLDDTLRLGPEDGGTREAPVVWAAAPGQRPVLSGGRRVTGWRAWRGPILRAELPGARGGRWPFRQLFCAGRRLPRARWPKADPADPLYGGWALTEGPAEPGSTDAFVYRPGTFRQTWAKPAEVEVVYWAGIGGWGSRVPVRAHDPQRRAIALAHSGWQFDVPGWHMSVAFTADNRFYVENALEELTEPGEWCFDSEEGALYLWPPQAGAEGDVVAPHLTTLVAVRGAAWVTLRGLTFTHTGDGDNFHREGVEGAGAMFPRPGWRYCGQAVHLRDASHCVVEGCRFDAVGGNAVYLEGDCARNRIAGNEVSHAGANGVCLMGTRRLHPFANEVVDNHIHHGGALCKYTAGVFCGVSDANRIAHNRIEHLPHHAVNLGNNPWGRNWVEDNLIRWVDEETADSAAINCWMEDPPDPGIARGGHVIRGNCIYDVRGCEVTEGRVGPAQRFPTSGIYLDNYSSHCVVIGNLVVRCTHAGILVHAGRNNLIEDNVVVDCLAGLRFQDYVSGMAHWRPMAGFMTGNRVRRNLCYHGPGRAFALSLHAWTDRVLAECDGNLYHCGDGAFAVEQVEAGRTFGLDEWRAQGWDLGAIVADPQFVDPARDDYRLRPGSPALRLGLRVPDPALAGPRPRGG